MSVIRMNYFSQALNMYTSVNLILPMPRHASDVLKPLPVLYLLHGMGDDFSCWLRKTGVERYALAANLAVVMPDGGVSCYENMAQGPAYRDYICKELPQAMSRMFPLSQEREYTFIAGCSMGGFGALKIGLAQPECFSAIGCFSAAHEEYRGVTQRNREILMRVYGQGGLEACNQRIVEHARQAAASEVPLLLWHGCGEQDILRDLALGSRTFFESLPCRGLNYHFEMLPGAHNWDLWDRMLARFISALKLEKPEVQLF